jgi:CDP-glucose 4,6-dehydratase
MEKLVNKDFWIGKRVLVTGHTGFKGTWLCHMLHLLGAKIYGYALRPAQDPNLFEILKTENILTRHTLGDIRNLDSLISAIEGDRPEIVFHLAAQPLVKESYVKPVETYQSNVMGTLNCLEAIRLISSVQCAVMITTDKVYENREWVWGYREDEHLGGHDPYSSSKACCEILISSYRRSFFQGEKKTRIASARAGNVIGGGDFATDRIIPDIFRAAINHSSLKIRYPHAIRPWQHVFEPLHAYLALAQKLSNATTSDMVNSSWNIGPRDSDVLSVQELVETTLTHLGSHAPRVTLANDEHPHEAGFLKLDISKIKNTIGWHPILNFTQGVSRTANWYRAYIEEPDLIYKYSVEDVKSYLSQRKSV